MATPEKFGDRKHFVGDGCDTMSVRHRMGLQQANLKNSVFYRAPKMSVCRFCDKPVMEEEFDCGNHPAS